MGPNLLCMASKGGLLVKSHAQYTLGHTRQGHYNEVSLS